VTHSAQDGSSQSAGTSSNETSATAAGGALEPAGAELVAAHRDPATGLIMIPTPITGNPLKFRAGAKCLDEEQHLILGPLGIKREYDPGAVIIFLLDAMRRGFDPYSSEIFLLRYNSRVGGPTYVHHIGIHGMERHVAETGLFGGVKPIRYCGDDGEWREVWPYRDAAPYACKVVMTRLGWDEPIEMVGYYDEYAPLVDEWITEKGNRIKTGNQVPAPMWLPASKGGKPTIMLSKCTRALAFRQGWPAKLGNWFEPSEWDRQRAESDDVARTAQDSRAARREQAYAASQGGKTVDGDALGVTLTEVDGDPDTMPADRVRAMLGAELAAQAGILGKGTDFMVARWEQKAGRPWSAASVGEMAAHLRNIRPYVVTALRTAGRHETADRYAEAPMPGTLAELFGTDQAAGDAQKVAA